MRHDNRLWSLRSCLIAGTITKEDDQWLFRPARFTPGMGVGGPLSYIRLLVKGRRTTSRYLRARNLERPAAAWDEVTDLLSRSEAPQPGAP